MSVSSSSRIIAQLAASRGSDSVYGGRWTPRSVTMAETSAAGVTSNAGFRAGNRAVTSAGSRSSIGMSAPEAVGRVERRRRRDDDERQIVVGGEHRQRVGADLVRGVAVRGDAVGAGDDHVDLPARHERCRRAVRDHGVRDPERPRAPRRSGARPAGAASSRRPRHARPGRPRTPRARRRARSRSRRSRDHPRCSASGLGHRPGRARPRARPSCGSARPRPRGCARLARARGRRASRRGPSGGSRRSAVPRAEPRAPRRGLLPSPPRGRDRTPRRSRSRGRRAPRACGSPRRPPPRSRSGGRSPHQVGAAGRARRRRRPRGGRSGEAPNRQDHPL